MLFSELKCKDVINIRDCKKLGHVCDLEFDECSGCICKIMVPGGNQWLGFLRCEPNIVIPYKDIRRKITIPFAVAVCVMNAASDSPLTRRSKRFR